MDWLNCSRYPALDLVIGLIANDDSTLRVTDPHILARLLREVVEETVRQGGGTAR
jgi:hypothetical protein